MVYGSPAPELKHGVKMAHKMTHKNLNTEQIELWPEDLTNFRALKETDEWRTPDKFFHRCMNAFGGFDLDAAANSENCKARIWGEKSFLGPGSDMGEDALSVEWHSLKLPIMPDLPITKKVWLNPPYGGGLMPWVEKAIYEARKGCFVVMLLPCDISTEWWRLLRREGQIWPVDGRIRFEGRNGHGPAFASILGVIHPPVDGVIWPTGIVNGSIAA